MEPLSLNSFFPPYATLHRPDIDDSALKKRLAKHPIPLAQEIIARFGLFSIFLLGQPLTEKLEALTPDPKSPYLKERIALVLGRYQECLKTGGNTLRTFLKSKSDFIGKKVEEVIDKRFDLLKYLPMPVEQLWCVLLASPPNSWDCPIGDRFKNFHINLTRNCNEETEWLFSLQISDHPYDASKTERLQKFVLSKAAFPIDKDIYVPFIDAFAEWIAYLACEEDSSSDTSLKPFYNFTGLSRIGLSSDFILDRSKTFIPKVKERIEKDRYAQNLSFQSYLNRRSFYIFQDKLNLSFSDTFSRELILAFEGKEDLRRAFVFFSCSSDLQGVALSESTPTSLFDPCLCFSKLKNWLLLFAEQAQTPTLDRASLSLLFEWLFKASHQDLMTFNDFYKTSSHQDFLKGLEELQKLDKLQLSSDKMLIILIFIVKNHDTFQKALTFIDKLALTFYYKKSLKIIFLENIYDQKADDFFKTQESFTHFLSQLKSELDPQDFHIVFVYCLKASLEDQQSFFANPSYNSESLLTQLKTMETSDTPLEERLAILTSEAADLSLQPGAQVELPFDLQLEELPDSADREIEMLFSLFASLITPPQTTPVMSPMEDIEPVREWIIHAREPVRKTFETLLVSAKRDKLLLTLNKVPHDVPTSEKLDNFIRNYA